MNSRFALGSRRGVASSGGAAAIVAVLLGGGVLLGASALALDVGKHHVGAPSAPERRRCRRCRAGLHVCEQSHRVYDDHGNRHLWQLQRQGCSTSNDRVCEGLGHWFHAHTEPGRMSSARTAPPGGSEDGRSGACVPLPGFMKTTRRPRDAVRRGERRYGEVGHRTHPSSRTLQRAVDGIEQPSRRGLRPGSLGARHPHHQRSSTSSCPSATGSPRRDTPARVLLPTPLALLAPFPATQPEPGRRQRRACTPRGTPRAATRHRPGGTAPGGFAALKAATTCQAIWQSGLTGKLWADGDPGNDLPCSDAQLLGLLAKVLYVPLFDCQTDAPTTVTAATDCSSGNGGHNSYRISGFAAFYFAGWH